VGDAATILRWSGAAWTMVTDVGSPAVANLHDVWGTAAAPGQRHLVWIVGDAGAVRSFDGAVWHVDDADARYMLRGVWGAPSGVLRVAGTALLPMVAQIPGAEAVVLRRNADGSWAREGVFQELRGISSFERISGASDTNIWAVGVKHPSGAAVGFAFAAHFDGMTWSAQAGVEYPLLAPETVIIRRIFTDVAVSTPDAPAGAWFTDGNRTGAVRFDGTTWSSPDPVASGLLGIDVRGAAMWAAGFDGKVVRWTPAGWVVSNPAVPGS
jgi:hypothetical protein